MCQTATKNRRIQTGKLKLNKKRKEFLKDLLSDLFFSKFWTCRSHSFSFIFSHHIPLLFLSHPSTVRERLCCCDCSTRELLWHSEHKERGEPSDSELPNTHPSSWQRSSMVMWQLKAALPSSQFSRMSATTSLDQSCPMTSKARHSLSCPCKSKQREVSLTEQEVIHPGF